MMSGRCRSKRALGFGLTPGSDKLTAKLILSSDLNGENGFFK